MIAEWWSKEVPVETAVGLHLQVAVTTVQIWTAGTALYLREKSYFILSMQIWCFTAGAYFYSYDAFSSFIERKWANVPVVIVNSKGEASDLHHVRECNGAASYGSPWSWEDLFASASSRAIFMLHYLKNITILKALFMHIHNLMFGRPVVTFLIRL